MKKGIQHIAMVAGCLMLTPVYADAPQALIPGNDGLYYLVGGGDVTPLPYDNGTDIDLNIGGNAGLGFNCGSFNPEATIINSVNGLKGSFGAIANAAAHNLTGIIIGQSSYVISKSMPNIYKVMTNALTFGQKDLSLSTKSCQTMLSEISQGQNPDQDMINAAIGQDWQYHMSMADSQASSQGFLGESNDDISSAKAAVEEDAGKDGVQWVQGTEHRGQLMAGGQGQPTIELTYDTILAGYNVLVGDSRQYDDKSAPAKTTDNQGITGVFASSNDAGIWARYVLGENTITTFAGGKKKTTPGKGLLHFVQNQTQILKPIISKLVTGQTPLTLQNLQQLDSPKITISPGVITAIQKLGDPTLEAIWVNRIAQGIAANRVINKAELIRQFLLVGSQVPSISANGPAQKGIQKDIAHLNMFIDSIRQGPGQTKVLLANSISTLLAAVHNQQVANASIRPASEQPVIQNGAIAQPQAQGQ